MGVQELQKLSEVLEVNAVVEEDELLLRHTIRGCRGLQQKEKEVVFVRSRRERMFQA